ncbi:MAG: MFS transporter [Firmicutes bacterium]|nr:MFS transporter [Bacillota bacterium]
MIPGSAIKKDTKKAMELNTVEGAFAVAADNLAAPYLGLFALALGATPSQIGMLTAFPNFLGNILQIPSALLAERLKDKRKLIIVGGILNRSSWILMAFLPFLFAPERRVSIVILLATFRFMTANLGVPAWTALQANLIPKSIRGAYYANRNMVLNTCAVLATLLANLLLRLEFPTSYRVIFLLTTVLGLLSVYIFSKILFEQSAPKAKQASKGSYLKKMKAFARDISSQKDFSNYVVSAIVWNLGIQVSSPLFVVFFVEDLGGPAGHWALFAAVNLASMVLIQRYWGRLADYFGQKSVMMVAGLGIISIPLFWWITPNTWFPFIIHVINGVFWGGYNLAAFNLLLEVTPDDNRSVYVGVYNTMMGVATAVGPLVGGFAAEVVGLKPIFLVSAAVRALALYLFYRNVTDSGTRRMRIRDLMPGHKTRGMGSGV